MSHRGVWISLLMLTKVSSTLDDETCIHGSGGEQYCRGAVGSAESEESSLLQQRKLSRSPKKECPLPDVAMPALKSGVEMLISGVFSDVVLDHTIVSKDFTVHKCGVNVAMGAALNISGLSQVGISTFDCDGSECIETGLFGICTKYKAKLLVGFKAPVVSLVGMGDANITLDGTCYLLKHLPEMPDFATSAQVTEPEVVLEFGVELDIFPPGVSDVSFKPVSVSYGRLENFDCGFSWWPTINTICNDWLDTMLNEMKDQILKFVNKQMKDHPELLEDEIMKTSKGAFR